MSAKTATTTPAFTEARRDILVAATQGRLAFVLGRYRVVLPGMRATETSTNPKLEQATRSLLAAVALELSPSTSYTARPVKITQKGRDLLAAWGG
jgi:hypothetical protein